MKSQLLTIDEFDAFKTVRDIPVENISKLVLDTVRDLDERSETGPFIQSILADTNDTPHGPVEIADILTHTVKRGPKLA